MSDITHCQRCGNKLDPEISYFFINYLDTILQSSKTVCKNCFLVSDIQDYLENGIFSAFLLDQLSSDGLFIQKLAGINAFCKLLATKYKIKEKILELERKFWFSNSLLREKLSNKNLELGDVNSYIDPVTNNYFLVQKQSKRTAIWLNDSVDHSIEISYSDEYDQSIILNNITASLENAVAIIDWVIANQSIIAANLH